MQSSDTSAAWIAEYSQSGTNVSVAFGTTKTGNGEYVEVGEAVGVVVAVGVGVTVVAGQVLASSTYWTCGWPSSVITMAEACMSCAPGLVAT